jgi:hypothetical protein
LSKTNTVTLIIEVPLALAFTGEAKRYEFSTENTPPTPPLDALELVEVRSVAIRLDI